jgi:hypothetical protein
MKNPTIAEVKQTIAQIGAKIVEAIKKHSSQSMPYSVFPPNISKAARRTKLEVAIALH